MSNDRYQACTQFRQPLTSLPHCFSYAIKGLHFTCNDSLRPIHFGLLHVRDAFSTVLTCAFLMVGSIHQRKGRNFAGKERNLHVCAANCNAFGHNNNVRCVLPIVVNNNYVLLGFRKKKEKKKNKCFHFAQQPSTKVTRIRAPVRFAFICGQ